MIFETTIGFLSAIIGFLFCDILYKKMFDVSIWNRPENIIILEAQPGSQTPQAPPVIPVKIEAADIPTNMGDIDKSSDIPLPQTNGGNNV
jgi:hypothetical protein